MCCNILASLALPTPCLQNFFRAYPKLAGMTGTAATESAEFSQASTAQCLGHLRQWGLLAVVIRACYAAVLPIQNCTSSLLSSPRVAYCPKTCRSTICRSRWCPPTAPCRALTTPMSCSGALRPQLCLLQLAGGPAADLCHSCRMLPGQLGLQQPLPLLDRPGCLHLLADVDSSFPTHALPPAIARNENGKWKAVVQEIKRMHKTGRPVLVSPLWDCSNCTHCCQGDTSTMPTKCPQAAEVMHTMGLGSSCSAPSAWPARMP